MTLATGKRSKASAPYIGAGECYVAGPLMAEITKISTKGQVVIPNEIRKELGIEPGETLQVEQVGDLIVLKKIELKPLGKELRKATRGERNE